MFKRKRSYEREALDYALSKVFSDDIKISVLEYLETRYNIKINGKEPISKEDIEFALHEFLQAGAILIIGEFNFKLSELENASAA